MTFEGFSLDPYRGPIPAELARQLAADSLTRWRFKRSLARALGMRKAVLNVWIKLLSYPGGIERAAQRCSINSREVNEIRGVLNRFGLLEQIGNSSSTKPATAASVLVVGQRGQRQERVSADSDAWSTTSKGSEHTPPLAVPAPTNKPERESTPLNRSAPRRKGGRPRGIHSS